MPLDLQQGKIFPMTLSDKGFSLGEAVVLNLADIKSTSSFGNEEHEYTEPPRQALIHQGRLYLVPEDFTRQDEGKRLMSYDLKQGGDPKQHQAQGVLQMTPYKDGKLLALVPGESKEDASFHEMKMDLVVYNPADDSLSRLGSSGIAGIHDFPGLVYDPAGDFVYLMGKDTIYRWAAEDKVEPCAYITPSNSGGSFSGMVTLLPSGQLFLARSQQLFVRGTDPSKLAKGRLTIYGSHMGDDHKKAIRALDGIPVNFLEREHFSTAEQLGQALVSGEDGIDIFFLHAQSIDLQSLVKKGYCVDLSDSAALMQYARSLYPKMQELALSEGKLFLVPVRVEGKQIMSYYDKILEEAGLEPPKDFAGLCNLIQHWNDELTDKMSNYTPLATEDFNKKLTALALTLYADRQAVRGEPISFSDPLLKEMLTRAMQVKTQNISPKVDWESPGSLEAINQIFNRPAAISEHFILDLTSLHHALNRADDQGTTMGFEDGRTYEIGNEHAMMLSAKEGEAPVAALNLTVMALNPKSKNLESAIRYMEAYVAGLGDEIKATMNPDMNEDIPNPDFETQMDMVNQYVKGLEKALQKAEGAEKTELQSQYDMVTKDLEKQKEIMRLKVSAKTIQYYRELIENSYIVTWGGVETLFEGPDMQKLLLRFTQGQIPLDQFLNEAEGKMRLMQLERE